MKNNINRKKLTKIAYGAILIFALALANSIFLSHSVLACSYQQPQCPDITIQKSVRDVTAGQVGFIDSVAAQNNDQLMFQIDITNSGTVVLNNVFVRDILPAQLQYVSGSVRVDNATYSDSLVSGGLSVGSLGVNSTRVITFEATINSANTTGTQTITNTAYVRADNVPEKSDVASAVVSNVSTNRDLNISKTVRNESSGSSFSDNISANNNDQLMFQIQIQNTGNANLSNIFVRDVLPSFISFNGGSTRVDGSSVADGITNGGINIGSLNIGTTKTITFELTANFSGSPNNQILTNTAYARADQVNEKNDSATVIMSGSQNQNGDLSINKTVRNVTSSNSGYFESVNAQNNDRLEFRIQIQNTGNTTLNNVFVRDTLPNYLSYVYGSAQIDDSFLSDQIISGGVNIGSLFAGNSRIIIFDATVNSYNYNGYNFYGSQTLTNYAYARADQVSERNDSATIYISSSNSFGTYLNLNKYVRNITAGQTGLLSSANANQGDHVIFTIQVSTPSNNQVNNVRVWDNLPSGLNYVTGTTRLDNGYIADNLFSGGITVGSLYGNQTRTVTFEAIVSNVSYANSQTLVNDAYASADNVTQQTAFAQVVVNNQIIYNNNPSATITKKVTNLTSSNGSDSENSASVGNTLQYTITFTNNGPGVLNNIRVTDTLPSYVTFQTADSGGSFNSANNQVSWYNGNLANGTSLNFTYRVTVQAVPYNGFVIINTASGSADNLSSINSNEVRTTVGGVVKGAVVKAVTGSNALGRNIAAGIMIALWSIFILYFIIEYGNFWKNASLKLAILKLKFKNRLI